jgi:hypothetical protein
MPSFNIRHLSVQAYAGGNTLWSHNLKSLTSTEGLNTVMHEGYMNSAHDMLSVGDVIFFHFSDGAAMRAVADIAPHKVVLARLD